MQVIDPRATAPSALRGAVVAIGNFDGVHRGHQELLRVAAKQAKATGRVWGLVTFEPHPRSFFKPTEPVFRLTPPALKERLVQRLGADFIIHLPFDAALASLEPDDFIKQHLEAQLAVSHVVTGYDFHFGKGRKGNPASLQAAGKARGFTVTSVEQVSDDGDGQSPFSSSTIRDSLRRGHLAAAAHDLGYRWMVMGQVLHGDARGRTLGFPTINIALEPGAEPFRGIYAVRVREASDKGAAAWLGAAYFGDRPTFETRRSFLEVHLLDLTADLYGKTMIVEFVSLLRADKRFSSSADLVAQMKRDCDEARRLLMNQPILTPQTSLSIAQDKGWI